MLFEWKGYCPICMNFTDFVARGAWFRDQLNCQKCDQGSIPRERAMMAVIRDLVPNYTQLHIHESSPAARGVSALLKREAPNYIATQYFSDAVLGTMVDGFRCEDIENQTFDSNVFDLVITQDVMEHVFNPKAAYEEVFRTLKPGGYYIHTTPIYKDLIKTEVRALLLDDGTIMYVHEPEYHGNPISGDGALVTYHFGYDLIDLIASWTDFNVECRRWNDRSQGIVAEFNEVLICRKPDFDTRAFQRSLA